MLNSFEVAALFGLDAQQMQKREEVGIYIHSFATLISERLYSNHLSKDPQFQNMFTSTDILRLTRMFGEYFSSLFIHPFDDRLLERTREIAHIHMSIGLKPIQVSRGFDILTEVIYELAGVNAKIREDIPIILKLIRISESVMSESYFESLVEYQKDMKQENEIASLFDRLYAGLTIHKQNYNNVLVWLENNRDAEISDKITTDAAMCPFETVIDEIASQKTLLLGLGIDLEVIRGVHARYHDLIGELKNAPEDQVGTLSAQVAETAKELNSIMNAPLEDISATSYLGVHSGIEFLQACVETMFDGTSGREREEIAETAHEKLEEQLVRTMGWCIDELYIGPRELSERSDFDIRRKIIFRKQRFSVGIRIKEVVNKTYMVEIAKILIEIVQLNFHSRERERALIGLVDEVERASKSKDMFLANMSHELRTPLNAIIGFSQILMMNKALPDNLRTYIEKISIAGNNLLTLVNTILDFAKLEAGKLTFKPEVTLVSGIIGDVASIIEPMAQKKSIRFDYPEMISLGLYLDKQLIMQVLLNLLSNAIKFTAEGGRVVLKVEFDEIKRVYCFSVCDNGVGIGAKDVATLFDPFTQAENPFQKTAKGTGLGLAIAKRIIEDLHGGAIWVESTPGEGSCFYFTIPVSQIQNTVERYASGRTGVKKMLIVEDAPEYQRMLIDRLSEHYDLTVTNSVNKAKELLEQEAFDFIILDFFLVDGISSEVLQFMELNRIEIPVIIISAEDDSKLIAHLPDAESVEGIFNKLNISEICNYLNHRME